MHGRRELEVEARIPRSRTIARVVVAAALLKGIVLAVLIPPFQTPDEYGHYDYAVYLSRLPPREFLTGALDPPARLVRDLVMTREVRAVAEAAGVLPHLTDAVIPRDAPPLDQALVRAARWRDDEEMDLRRARELNAIVNYPPLYHGTAALLLAAERAAGVNPLVRFYSARALSLACFLLTLVVARCLFDRLALPRIMTGAALFALAFHPELSMLSVSVQPDNLALLLVTTALLASVDWLRAPSVRLAGWFGALTGLLLLTKTHDAVAVLAAAATAAGLVLTLRRRARGRVIARHATIAAAVTALVGGWWYLRSKLLFGNWMGVVRWLPADDAGRFADNLRTWFHISVPQTFRSYWGMWGWFDYGIPDWAVPYLAAVSLLPTGLLALRLAAPPESGTRREAVAAALARPACAGLFVIGAGLLAFAVEIVAIGGVMGAVQNQGRHWLAFAVPQVLYLCAPVALVMGASRRALARIAQSATAVRASFVLLLLAALVSGTAALAGSWPEAVVEVRLQVDADARTTLYADTGVGFNAVESTTADVRRRDGQTVRVYPLAGTGVERLRFDVTAPGAVTAIFSIRLLDRDGDELARIPLGDAQPADGHAVLHADRATLVVAPRPTESTAAVELPLASTIQLPGSAISGIVRPLRWFWQRIYRRVPITTALAALWPSIALATLVLAWLASLHISSANADDSRARNEARTIAFALVALLLTLNVWLTTQTWRFYTS